MSFAAWYLNKADQCGRLANEATQPQRRDAYQQEQKRWLEIAAAVMRDEDKQPKPRAEANGKRVKTATDKRPGPRIKSSPSP